MKFKKEMLTASRPVTGGLVSAKNFHLRTGGTRIYMNFVSISHWWL